jgi:hypothetical protein
MMRSHLSLVALATASMIFGVVAFGTNARRDGPRMAFEAGSS